MQPLYEGTEAVLISLFSHGPLAKQGEVGKVSQFSRGWAGPIKVVEVPLTKLRPGWRQVLAS